ncbi:hypothetical protein [Pseudomonas sp. JH-2]|uniref:hypothetical protein n=1 Tax=Pseudomonas sp. JH-2 TaxID=3114998 RepID=UPI002E271690
MVFSKPLSLAVESGDFFTIAQAREADRYLGFVFGKPTLMSLNACLIIEPTTAAAYAENQVGTEES